MPLTSVLLRLPTSGQDLLLENDVTALEAGGYLFADHFDALGKELPVSLYVGPGGELASGPMPTDDANVLRHPAEDPGESGHQALRGAAVNR